MSQLKTLLKQLPLSSLYDSSDSTVNANIRQGFSNFNLHQNHIESLLKHRKLVPTFEVSESVSLVWSMRISICNKFPGDADTAGLRTTLCNPLPWGFLKIK